MSWAMALAFIRGERMPRRSGVARDVKPAPVPTSAALDAGFDIFDDFVGGTTDIASTRTGGADADARSGVKRFTRRPLKALGSENGSQGGFEPYNGKPKSTHASITPTAAVAASATPTMLALGTAQVQTPAPAGGGTGEAGASSAGGSGSGTSLGPGAVLRFSPPPPDTTKSATGDSAPAGAGAGAQESQCHVGGHTALVALGANAAPTDVRVLAFDDFVDSADPHGHAHGTASVLGVERGDGTRTYLPVFNSANDGGVALGAAAFDDDGELSDVDLSRDAESKGHEAPTGVPADDNTGTDAQADTDAPQEAAVVGAASRGRVSVYKPAAVAGARAIEAARRSFGDVIAVASQRAAQAGRGRAAHAHGGSRHQSKTMKVVGDHRGEGATASKRRRATDTAMTALKKVSAGLLGKSRRHSAASKPSVGRGPVYHGVALTDEDGIMGGSDEGSEDATEDLDAAFDREFGRRQRMRVLSIR